MPPPPEPERSFTGDLSGVWARRKQIWALVPRGDKAGFGAAVLVMAVCALVETRIPLVLGRVFDKVLSLKGAMGAELARYTLTALCLLAGAYVLKESLNYARRWLVARTATRIERDMMVRLVGHLLKVDLGVMASERVGSLHGRISRSVEGYVKFLKLSFTDAIPAVLIASFALIASFSAEWRVGLVMLAVVPVTIALTVWQVTSQKGVRLALMQAKEGLDGTLVEQLGGLEYIRAANTYRQEMGRVEKAAEARRARELKHHRAMAGFDWLKAVNENLFHVGIIGYAIYLASRGQIPFGSVLTFSMLFLNIMRPLKDVHRILDEAFETSLQVNVLLNMLQQPVDQSFGACTLRPPKLDGSVPLLSCIDLQVQYQTAQGPRRILDGVTLDIRQGQTIGIAGPSGSGKSTWLRAMLRLLHPSSGEVRIGGVPIGVLSREDIGKYIGYVSQMPFVFAGTVRENIAYGCGEASAEQIETAAKRAFIHDDIVEMSHGYDTPLTERGGNLSGGQRQRIAIARMFLKNPDVLILDEGTSALDNISERKVRAAIDEARHRHTVIMVAHRLSTLRDTDRIFVFDQGRVAEQGTYDELLARNGVFAELARSAETGCPN